jgi:hypothetical protein
MDDFLHRTALGAMALAGAAYLWAAAGPAEGPQAAYLHILLALLGLSLLAALAMPRLRAPAVGAAILGKLALLGAAVHGAPVAASALDLAMLAALVAAAAVLVRETVREARWDGVLPLRRES